MPRKSKNLPRTKPRIQEPAEDKAENKIRTDAYKKNQISKLRSSKLLFLSQTSLLQKRWAAVLPPGGLQSAAQRGRRVRLAYEVFESFRLSPFGFFFLEVLVFPLLNPPPVASGRLPPLRRSAALARLGASWAEKSRSKRPSKTDQILMPFQHRFLSVLAPFWRAKMAPKSIKNRSKLSFQAFLFPHRFLHRFFIEFSSQLRPTGSPKSMFFLRKNKVFSKNAFRR